MSSVASTSSKALSEAALATVSIVPSFGFITARYAVSTLFWNASQIIGTVRSSSFLMDLVKPLNNCDNMTPELPLAPRSEPPEIAFERVAMSGSESAATSFAADIIVIVMFMPVSPSGTGNTFNSFIVSLFASSRLAPARNIFARVFASIEVISTISSLVNDPKALDVDIYILHLHSGKFLDLVFDGLS